MKLFIICANIINAPIGYFFMVFASILVINFFNYFLCFVFILYIPINYCIESFPFFKKIDHFNYSNSLILSYSGNIQDFFFLYKGI